MKPVYIPVGTSDFREIRSEGYYYVDKSDLIAEIVKERGTKALLITRPRRFGKTMAMNMLSEFFDIRRDGRELFDGLSVTRNREVCENWQNQYPVLSLSFKTVDGLDFSGAYVQIATVMAELYKEHFYLTERGSLTSIDKELFLRIAARTADQGEIKNSLLFLTRLLADYYGKPVILLLDEYDVPLAKASEKGYYKEMLDIIKGMMQVIKDNPFLRIAVVTGCLRIAKESIFTGTNNFVSDTISDTRLNEFFGFTQAETDKLLQDTGLTDHSLEIKEWYDGYRFGEFNVYCPWDVMNHVSNLLKDPSSKPKNFWENTSDNAVIRMFLDRTSFDVGEKFEALLSGGYVKERITETLTYDVLESSEENLWSLLYLTGYLTKARMDEENGTALAHGEMFLRIPNREVEDIFRKSVKAWLADRTMTSDRRELFEALWNGDDRRLTDMISDLLFDTISYYDYQESFYHAFLTGLFSNAGFAVESNHENGLGRSDITVKDRKDRRAVVIEAKWTDSEEKLEKECRNALRQIEDRQYAKKLEHAGFKKVVRLGIAFWKKQCLVKKG